MKNSEILEKMGACFAAQDMEGVMACLHEDIVVTEAESLPFGPEHRGPAAFMKLLAEVFSYWDDMTVEAKFRVEEGDRSVVFNEISGKGKQSGKAYTMMIAETFRFKDDKIIEVMPFYFDTKKLLESQ